MVFLSVRRLCGSDCRSGRPVLTNPIRPVILSGERKRDGKAVAEKPSEAEIQEENRRIRRLQMMMSLVMSVISQGNLPLEEASELVASTKRAALNLFPGKERAYDLIYRPRLQRLLREKYRIC